MFNTGDLVNYVGEIDKYKGRPFTVIEPYNYAINTFFCRRGSMQYHRIFRDVELELVESRPKYLLGEPVEIEPTGFECERIVGVVVGSNQIATIIRRAAYTHDVQFVPNGRIRRIK